MEQSKGETVASERVVLMVAVWPVRRARWTALCHAPGKQRDQGNGVCWTRDAENWLGAQGWPF